MKPLRVLTGITTSGTPHLGNYVGAIRPSVRASLRPEVQSFYFLADYHALIKVGEPERIQRSTLEIAATWLAAGLDPDRVTFYRQSDIPEIPASTRFLTCMAGKGLLNRAHAYKAQVDKNLAAGADPDNDVSAGLFMYPVLMAADILMFRAHQVPVGRDQIQHIEMARDMAASFNHLYGPHLVLPEAAIEDNVATLPGLDGRKMSKSYDNTIALFGPATVLRKQIAAMVTDSRKPGEPKSTEGSALFDMYRAFASAEETRAMEQAYAQGIAWADAKQVLFERIDREIAPMRQTYEQLMADPGRIEEILRAGADKARQIASPFMQTLRQAVGLRSLRHSAAPADRAGGPAKASLPSLKQYRHDDGKFYFKLIDSDGQVLLQSLAFDSPRSAGELVARLKQGDAAVLDSHGDHLEPVSDPSRLAQALLALRQAADSAPP